MLEGKNISLLFLEIQQELSQTFPNLIVSKEVDKIIVKGTWSVYGKEEHIIDYDIKIVLNNDYPYSVPKVWEISNKIEKTKDRHFNQPDHDACLFVPPERWEQWPIGASFTDFLNGPVKAFFFSQAFYDYKGKWPFGEWSHGLLGVLEYYALKLGFQKIAFIKQGLQLALLPKLQRQWKCPCNNKTRLIRCHGIKITSLKEILPMSEIKDAINMLENITLEYDLEKLNAYLAKITYQ